MLLLHPGACIRDPKAEDKDVSTLHTCQGCDFVLCPVRYIAATAGA